MNRLVRKSATPFGALVTAVFFLILTIIISTSSVSRAEGIDGAPKNGRLVTIYDRGVEKVILTQGITIGDALKDAGVTVDAMDAIEPAASEKMIANNYKVNIYRSRPVLIVDGNIRQKIMTPFQTTEQIAKSANITLFPEDKAIISQADNIVDGVGLKLTITRAVPFQFMLYGKLTTARTQSETIGEMLVEKGIKLESNDRVLPSIDQQIIEGMPVRIWREGKQTVTVDEPIDFEIESIQNADQPVSYLNVTSVGVVGLKNVTYEISIEDGIEVSRVEIASVEVVPAKKQVQVVGVKGKYATPSENQTITWNYLLSQGFSKIQAAGIMGNLMQEHRFNTSDTAGGLGIVQWTGGRRTELLSRVEPENIYTQLDFLMYELNGGYKYVQAAIKNATTIEDSVRIFQNQFERCGKCMESNRVEYAYGILGSQN